GQKMRQTGLAIISSMIKALPTVPLTGTGYDLATGKPWDHIWLAPWLRNATEDLRVLIKAYRRERALGRAHPEWFNWVKTYVDWLVRQQRADGSFPRRWQPGSSGLCRELDLDLEPAHAGGRRRRAALLEDRRPHHRNPRHHRPGRRQRGRVSRLGRSFLCQTL